MQGTTDIIIGWLSANAALPSRMKIAEDTELIEQGVIDSMAILELVAFLEERFALALPLDEFVPENFVTAQAIVRMVMRLCDGADLKNLQRL
jgi:acyl carrier protein